MKRENYAMTITRAIEILGRDIDAPFWSPKEEDNAERFAAEVLQWVFVEFGEEYEDTYNAIDESSFL